MIYRLLIVVLAMTVLNACTSTVVEAPRNQPRNIRLQVNHGISEIALNVGLTVFDPGLSGNDQEYSNLAQIRLAEAHYLAYVLKLTLDQSRHFGAVRVLPESDPAAELKISGKILESNGVELRIRIAAIDSTGRTWIDREYADLSIDHRYSTAPEASPDPFQDLFNQVVNDLVQVKEQSTRDELDRMLNTSMLRYAIELSPQSFSDYLETDGNGLVVPARLPHRQDPMFNRVTRIRESEYAFADTVDGQYETLFHRMRETYEYWRRYSYELIMGNRILEESDGRRGARPGSWQAMASVYKTFRDSKMNEDALRELGESFDNEVSPTLIRVENDVVELSGSLARQYRDWRRILTGMYESERGIQ